MNNQTVLLVEDSPSDRAVLKAALMELKHPPRVEIAVDGVEALSRLRGTKGARLEPQLIILDLNMPRMDGREVLRHIKSDPALRAIPVVVLSTSEADTDIRAAYQAHANAYLVKPVDYEQLAAGVAATVEYWLRVVQLAGPVPATQEKTRPDLPPIPKTVEPIRVLLVEDSPTDALLLKHALETHRHPHSVLHVERIADAHQQVGQSFDVVITDLGLPDAQGLEAFRQLHSLFDGTPIIVLTGSDDEHMASMAIRAGAQDYLVKDRQPDRDVARAVRLARERQDSARVSERDARRDAAQVFSDGMRLEMAKQLTVIDSFSTLITDTVSDERAQSFAEAIRGALDSLIVVARQLDVFAASDNDDHNFKTVGVDDLVLAMSGELRGRAGARLTVTTDRDTPAAEVDIGQLEDVIRGLCHNAAEAAETGTIGLTTGRATFGRDVGLPRRSGDYAVITVSDEGPGVPPELRPKIWMPFFTTKDAAGEGWPLSRIQSVVERMRGWLEIDSDSQGTHVKVHLPRSTRPPRMDRPDAPAVVVAHRDASLRAETRAILRSRGYETIEADDEETLLRAVGGKVSLVVADLSVTDHGAGLTERILQRNPDVRIVYTGGAFADIPPVDRGGGESFLVRPFRSTELIRVARKTMAGAH